MNITKAHLSVGTLITVIPLVAAASIWYDGRRDDQHGAIVAQVEESREFAASESYRKSVDLELQAINLELKILRTIQERRPLTLDEEDRLAYLVSLREILLEAQREQVE